MGFQENLTIYTVIVIPLVTFICSVIILASLGKSLGVRNLYIKVLVFIFTWGRERIQRHASKDHMVSEINGCYDDADDKIAQKRSIEELDEDFQLSDSMYFAKNGIQAIVADEVTKSFAAAELSSWNLLTRTNRYEFISVRLTVLWLTGCILRYCILFPFRLILACFAIGLMFMGTLVIGQMPNGKLKKTCHTHLALTAYRVMSRAFSAVVTFHNRENRASGGGICVANHTSPIDIIILGGDNCYSMVGQQQGGFFGIMQRAFSRAETHIWFQRKEAKDRKAVAKKLKDHASDPNKLPILIFPEGTCINNEHILQFKKGSFEVGVPVYPVAIKYNPLFADPFWNSDKQGILRHLALIMSSWALVLDIWYLPPTTIKENETSIEFANRVKSLISHQGGLVDLDWDGALKRTPPKEAMKKKEQEEYIIRKSLNKNKNLLISKQNDGDNQNNN